MSKGKREGAQGEAGEGSPAPEMRPEKTEPGPTPEHQLAKRVEALEYEVAVMREEIESLKKHLNLQAVLRPEQVLEALRKDPRSAFVVASPFKAGQVSLAQGQVIDSTGHNVEMLARAGAPLRHAA